MTEVTQQVRTMPEWWLLSSVMWDAAEFVMESKGVEWTLYRGTSLDMN